MFNDDITSHGVATVGVSLFGSLQQNCWESMSLLVRSPQGDTAWTAELTSLPSALHRRRKASFDACWRDRLVDAERSARRRWRSIDSGWLVDSYRVGMWCLRASWCELALYVTAVRWTCDLVGCHVCDYLRVTVEYIVTPSLSGFPALKMKLC